MAVPQTFRLYRFTVGTPPNLHMLHLTDAKKRLDCTAHNKHTAKFTCVAVHRCKETSRLYRFTISTLPNLHLLLLTDAIKVSTVPIHHGHTANFTCVAARRCKKNVSTVPNHQRHTAKSTHVAAQRCKETSRLYRFTVGTPRNLHVMLLTDAKRNVSTVPLTISTLSNLHLLLFTDAIKVSTVPIHHGHTANFTCVAAHRCKKRFDCTESPQAQREI